MRLINKNEETLVDDVGAIDLIDARVELAQHNVSRISRRGSNHTVDYQPLDTFRPSWITLPADFRGHERPVVHQVVKKNGELYAYIYIHIYIYMYICIGYIYIYIHIYVYIYLGDDVGAIDLIVDRVELGQDKVHLRQVSAASPHRVYRGTSLIRNRRPP